MEDIIMLDICHLRGCQSYLLLNCISINFICNEVVEDVSDVVTPVQKKPKEN